MEPESAETRSVQPIEQIIRLAGTVARRLATLDDRDRIERRALRASLVDLERDARLTLDVIMADGRSLDRHLGALGHHLIGRAAADPADREVVTLVADDLEHVAQLFATVDHVRVDAA